MISGRHVPDTMCTRVSVKESGQDLRDSAPDAHVIADGQTAEICGHEANILKQKVSKFSETL